MSVSWPARARDDLTALMARIAADDTDAAICLRDRIFDAVGMLRDYPAMGRTGRLPETGELVLPGTTYLIVYRSREDGTQILRLLHGARDWPGSR